MSDGDCSAVMQYWLVEGGCALYYFPYQHYYYY